MPDYQPFPVRPTVFGTVLDGTSIVSDFLHALARARLRYEDAGMLDTPPPPDVARMLDQLVEVHADLATLDPAQPGDQAEAVDLNLAGDTLVSVLVRAAAEGEPGWSVYVGEHDRQLAADLLLAADESDALGREQIRVEDTCPDCGHLKRSRHVVTPAGDTVCVELIATADGALADKDCGCVRSPLRLVAGDAS